MEYLADLDSKRNINISTVSDLIKSIKNCLFDSMPVLLAVEGEVSNVKFSQNHNLFFALNDANKSIDAVYFSYRNRKTVSQIIEGVKVVVYGKLIFSHSSCKIDVYNVKKFGVGDLFLAFENKKQLLRNAGFFNGNKMSVPYSYQIDCLGVITSSEGAVINDIVEKIAERYPMNIKIYSSLMQGKDAVSAIIRGLNHFQSIGVSVILIARGGGSKDDLKCFNDDSLVKAVFECKIPVISAIGHQKDKTLIDLVSDVSVSTPTAAAELLSTPSLKYLKEILSQHQLFHSQNISSYMKDKEADLFYNYEKLRILAKNNVCVFLNSLTFLYGKLTSSSSKAICFQQNKLNIIVNKLQFNANTFKYINELICIINDVEIKLNYSQKVYLLKKQTELDRKIDLFHKAFNKLIVNISDKLFVLNQSLRCHNPFAGLKNRGIVMHKNKVIHSVKGIKKENTYSLIFSDGKIDVKLIPIKDD